MLKTCPVCKSEYTTNREKAIYCGNACRMVAYRKRNDIDTKIEPLYSVCQNPRCTNPIQLGGRADTKYCSSSCRKHMMNQKAAIKKKAIDNFIKELMGD